MNQPPLDADGQPEQQAMLTSTPAPKPAQGLDDGSTAGTANTGFLAAVERFDEAADEVWGTTLRGSPLADRVFYVASELGDFSVVWLILGAAQGLRSDRDADAALRLGALLLLESIVVNQGVKRLIKRPRPVATDPAPYQLRTPQTSSFPSGHASSALAAAGIMSARHPRWAPAYYATAAIVATSRIHVKVHHASDVLAGAAVGIVFARLANKWWPASR